jgi:hypothetical protein
MITDPQAIRFANENARTIADLIGRLDRTLDQFALNVVRDFESQTGGNANGEEIDDGAAADGRNVVTKLNVGELKYVCEQLKACMDTDDRRAIVNRWAVNSQPIY